jgi:hypothetical protein
MIRECIHHKSFKQKLALYGMTTNQINSLAAAKRTNPVITIYSPNGIVQGTESMTTAAGSMQFYHNELFNIERRRLYKKR